jgi:heme/copper-type cytochrome/quinol oxidase subunit 3
MAHDLAHGHEHVEVTNTGIDNRKLGFWLFLSSESVFFASLIVAYLVYHGKNGSGPSPHELFNIPLTSVSTFVLLMSSLAMVLGVNAAQTGDAKRSMRWVAATAAMGAIFLGFQAYEFTHFFHEGLSLSSSLFGTTFYVLTGFHGAHVAVGVIWMLSLLFYGRKGGLGADKAGEVEVAGLYWHFVDVVWIVLFTVLYLLEFAQ